MQIWKGAPLGTTRHLPPRYQAVPPRYQVIPLQAMKRPQVSREELPFAHLFEVPQSNFQQHEQPTRNSDSLNCPYDPRASRWGRSRLVLLVTTIFALGLSAALLPSMHFRPLLRGHHPYIGPGDQGHPHRHHAPRWSASDTKWGFAVLDPICRHFRGHWVGCIGTARPRITKISGEKGVPATKISTGRNGAGMKAKVVRVVERLIDTQNVWDVWEWYDLLHDDNSTNRLHLVHYSTHRHFYRDSSERGSVPRPAPVAVPV